MQTCKRENFLAKFAETGSVLLTAKAVGCNRRSHYDWMRNDPLYRRTFGLLQSSLRAEALEAMRKDLGV